MRSAADLSSFRCGSVVRAQPGLAVPQGLQSLKGLGGAEGADNNGRVALVGVDFGIQVAHFFGGDFVGEIGKGGAELWEFGNGVAADDGDGVVGREVVLVVDEGNEAEGINE